MKKDESISDLQTRFTHIINNLHALGKVVDNEQQIGKVMRCLTREWQPKITAIAESKDLANMTIATLFGKLREHEMELHKLNESEQPTRKSRGLSLKAQTHKAKSEPYTEDSESESDEEPEIGFSKGDTNDSKVITCYECGKTGHIRSECYKLQNKSKAVKTKGKDPQPSKRAYVAWNDNDEDSSDDSEDEEANLCLMANTDSESDSEVSTTSNPSYDELHDAFNELHAEYETHELKCDVAKFNSGKNNLDRLLSNQRDLSVKFGLGYKQHMHVKRHQKFVKSKQMHDNFTRPKLNSSPAVICHFCCKKGHMVFNCKLKKLANRGWKQIWKVKKQAFETDPPGPNLNWEGGCVKYGDNNKGKILGIGDIGSNSIAVIKDVLFVEGLKHNLLSISQLCDKGFQVHFTSMSCTLEHKEVKGMKLTGKRVNNIYMIDFDSLPANDICCLLSNADENWLWHKRVAHIHMDHLNRLVRKQLVLGLPNRKFSKDRLFDSGVRSFGGNLYGYVLVDDYTSQKIISIKSDHGGEFQNDSFQTYCEHHVNRVLIRPLLKKTPYELYKGRKPNLSYFRIFGCKYFVLNNGKEHLDSEPLEPSEPVPPTNLDCVEPIRESDLPKEWKFTKNHPIDNIIGDISRGVATRKNLRQFCNFTAFVSQVEPKNVKEALLDSDWVVAMQEELNQFERNQVWNLVPEPEGKHVIGTSHSSD
ncbi:uncharacterized protein [Cicer arietinum]|uniref:Uncharacterized protein LOC101496769 n=1 Tax=Cicer arietinum TaxID=3827 RepID=A0A1S2Y6G3_CICAR|nr:uncharacterized protein LOC101496769 [Cicer arietinum]